MNEPKGVETFHRTELNAARFLIQRCTKCGAHVYYPRELCPNSGGTALKLTEPKGLGTVYAVTTVWRKPAEGGDLDVALHDEGRAL